MTKQRASAKDTTNAAAYFISLHKTLGVDEDGFLTVGASSERVILGKDDLAHPVSIYQDPMPDANTVGTYYVCNPFAMSPRASTAMRLIYRTQRSTVAAMIINLIKNVVMQVLHNRKIKINHDDFVELEISQPVSNLVAKKTEAGKIIASEIDEKTFHEVLTLADGRVVRDLVHRIYAPAKLSTYFNIPFVNNLDWFAENFEINLRKKTLHVLKAIILGVLGVADGKELTKKYSGVSEDDEPSNFAAGMRALLVFHKQVNPYFVGISDEDVIDLKTLETQISKIKNYSARARMVTTDKVVKQDVVKVNIPAAQPRVVAPVQAPVAQQPMYQQPQQPQPLQPAANYNRQVIQKAAPAHYAPNNQQMQPPMMPMQPQMYPPQMQQPAFYGQYPQPQQFMGQPMGQPMAPSSIADRLPSSRRQINVPPMPQPQMANMGFYPAPQQNRYQPQYPVNSYGKNFGEYVNNAPFAVRG